VPTFTVTVNSPKPDLIPGLLAVRGIASRGRFGGTGYTVAERR
jgi:hypothetical protein